MRSCVSRSIIGAGLHPAIGLHHHSRLNGFALADDLVEPFRPLVDGLVRRMTDEGVTTVTSDAKQRLVRLIGHDLRLGGAVSPVSMAAQRLAHSLARSFEERKPTLALFDPPKSEEHTSELQSLMRISYAVSCLKQKKNNNIHKHPKHA